MPVADSTFSLTDRRANVRIRNLIDNELAPAVGGLFRNQSTCRTTMEVGALPTPIAIELKCIAHLGQD